MLVAYPPFPTFAVLVFIQSKSYSSDLCDVYKAYELCETIRINSDYPISQDHILSFKCSVFQSGVFLRITSIVVLEPIWYVSCSRESQPFKRKSITDRLASTEPSLVSKELQFQIPGNRFHQILAAFHTKQLK